MRRLKACFAGITVSLALSAASAASGVTLQFLGDFNMPTSTVVDGTAFGGLSGIVFDPASNLYVAVSDDRSNLAPARWYSLDIRLENDALAVTPVRRTELLRQDGTPFPVSTIDAEGIVSTTEGHYLISSEGDGRVTPRLAPSVFVTDKTGRVVSELAIPDKFIPDADGDLRKGVISNGAFEGLAITPDGSKVIAMIEYPLFQDDTVASFDKGSLNRAVVFERNAQGVFVASREFLYPVEALKPVADAESAGNGVSEILALSDTELLVMERGGAVTTDGVFKTQVRLYKVNLSSGSDVSASDSIIGTDAVPVSKELILDLDTVIPQLSPGFQSLDNLEALAFGPAAGNDKTLLVVSDNNFSESQRTQFLLFLIAL